MIKPTKSHKGTSRVSDQPYQGKRMLFRLKMKKNSQLRVVQFMFKLFSHNSNFHFIPSERMFTGKGLYKRIHKHPFSATLFIHGICKSSSSSGGSCSGSM